MFSVRAAARCATLVLLIAGAALPDGAVCRAADDPEAALVNLGAVVTRDAEDPQHPIAAVDLHQTQITDSHLALLDGLTTLKRLDLSDCFITASDAGLAHISTLTGLEQLTFFDGHEASDRWLAPLGNLKQLKSLDLNVKLFRFSPVIHDKGIANLKPLVNLEHLVLAGWEITDKSIPVLEGMTELRELELVFTAIKDKGIVVLKQFPHLRKLTIKSESFLNDNSLQVLEELPELESLTLVGNKFTGDALTHLRAPKLRELEVQGPGFGDEIFPHLQALPDLEHVHFKFVPITDRGLEKLNKLHRLKTIEINQCRVNGSGLMALKDVKELRNLIFAGDARIPQQPNGKMRPDTLKCLKNFPLLESLCFARSLAGNRSIEYLKHVPRLKHLDLPTNKLDDEGMIHLTPLTELESLDLTFDNVSGPGLAHLAKLKKMRRLVIPFGVTDEGLGHIAELPELRELDLAEAKITDQGMPLFGKLTKLEDLSLMRCGNLTDRGLESLSGLTRLRNLELMDSKIGDPTVGHIVKLQELRKLKLVGTSVTKAGIDQLAALPNLSKIEITDPDRQAVRRLQEHNPKVLVYGHSEQVFLRGVKW